MYPREQDTSQRGGRAYYREQDSLKHNLGSQQSEEQLLELRTKRTAAKMIQLLQPSSYPQQSPSSQLNGQANNHAEWGNNNFDLNSSSGLNKMSTIGSCVPVIKDLNQERMIQRLKSRTIHSDNSASKQDNLAAQADANEKQSGWEGSPNLQSNIQNNPQNVERTNIHLNPQIGCPQQYNQARSQSREKEIIQSTNLNSLENEWSKMKKDHNFDNRSQSPFRFQSPFTPGNTVQALRSSMEGISLKEPASSCERPVDSSRKQFDINENKNCSIRLGESKQKQKTLIKKSVPLSKINLELIKNEQMSGRYATSGRKTPKSAANANNSKALTPSSESKIINNSSCNMYPSNAAQGNSPSSSIPNRQNKTISDSKEEHFQIIQDKYQNVHKKQGHQQIQAINLSSSYISNNENSGTSFEILPSNQTYHPYQSCLNQQENQSVNLRHQQGLQQQQQQIPQIGNGNQSQQQSQQSPYSSYQIHKSSHNILQQVKSNDNGNSPGNHIYNFSSKIVDTNTYHTSHSFIQPKANIISQSPIPTRKDISQQISKENNRLGGDASQERPSSTQSNYRIHNSIKVMSPKSNDLKSISNRNNINPMVNHCNQNNNLVGNLHSSMESIQSQNSFNQENNYPLFRPNNNSHSATEIKQKKIGQQQYQQMNTVGKERDVKQLIMSKIHKMNVAKIFLKEEESGQNQSSNCSVDASTSLSSNEQDVYKPLSYAQNSPSSQSVRERNIVQRTNSPNSFGVNGQNMQVGVRQDIPQSGLHDEQMFRYHQSEQPTIYSNQLNSSAVSVERQVTSCSNGYDLNQSSLKKKPSNSNLQQTTQKSSQILNLSNFFKTPSSSECYPGGSFIGQNASIPSSSSIPYSSFQTQSENIAKSATCYENQNNINKQQYSNYPSASKQGAQLFGGNPNSSYVPFNEQSNTKQIQRINPLQSSQTINLIGQNNQLNQFDSQSSKYSSQNQDQYSINNKNYISVSQKNFVLQPSLEGKSSSESDQNISIAQQCIKQQSQDKSFLRSNSIENQIQLVQVQSKLSSQLMTQTQQTPQQCIYIQPQSQQQYQQFPPKQQYQQMPSQQLTYPQQQQQQQLQQQQQQQQQLPSIAGYHSYRTQHPSSSSVNLTAGIQGTGWSGSQRGSESYELNGQIYKQFIQSQTQYNNGIPQQHIEQKFQDQGAQKRHQIILNAVQEGIKQKKVGQFFVQ